MDFDVYQYEKQLLKRRKLRRRIGCNLAFAVCVCLLMLHFAYPILWPAFTAAYYVP